MFFLEIKNRAGQILFSNISKLVEKKLIINNKNTKISDKLINSKQFQNEATGLDIWFISKNEIDFYKSNRLVKKTMLLYWELVLILYKKYLNNIESNSYDIKNIQLNMYKEISSFTRQEDFSSSSYNELIKKIQTKIIAQPLKASILIININNYNKWLFSIIDDSDQSLNKKFEEIDSINIKFFSKSEKLYGSVIEFMYVDFIKKIDLNSHTIITIQAKMSQEIDLFAREKEFNFPNKDDLISNIKNIVERNSENAAKLISQLRNRIQEISFHLESLNLLYYKYDNKISLNRLNLKKILLKMYSPFQKNFQKSTITVNFNIPDDYIIEINYDIFNLVMHHFFHNAEKYVQEWSWINIKIEDETKKYLIFEMISYEISNKEKIFEEWYSWANTEELAWNGIWMYVIKKWLLKMWMDIYIQDDRRAGINYNWYMKNIFCITLR